jgi:hypothetical protein
MRRYGMHAHAQTPQLAWCLISGTPFSVPTRLAGRGFVCSGKPLRALPQARARAGAAALHEPSRSNVNDVVMHAHAYVRNADKRDTVVHVSMGMSARGHVGGAEGGGDGEADCVDGDMAAAGVGVGAGGDSQGIVDSVFVSAGGAHAKRVLEQEESRLQSLVMSMEESEGVAAVEAPERVMPNGQAREGTPLRAPSANQAKHHDGRAANARTETSDTKPKKKAGRKGVRDQGSEDVVKVEVSEHDDGKGDAREGHAMEEMPDDNEGFEEWFLKALRNSIVGAQYPDAVQEAVAAVVRWRQRMDPKVFRKLCRSNRLLKVHVCVCVCVCVCVFVCVCLCVCVHVHTHIHTCMYI